MDLSSTKDLTAIVAVFPDDEGPGFDVLAQFFVPKDNIHTRSVRDKVPYEQWERDGYIVPTQGQVVNYERVRQELIAWSNLYEVKTVAFDKFNALDLVTRLQERDGFTCVQTQQGFLGLSSATKSVESAILSKALRHDGHPVMRWCVSNVSVVADDYGNLKISKKASSEKIDGVAALAMAVDQMERNNSVSELKYQAFAFGGAR
jgi:phage terminase large subunit-like protein